MHHLVDPVDIAEQPIDETVYDLISTTPHYGDQWERLTFRHKETGKVISRRRAMAKAA